MKKLLHLLIALLPFSVAHGEIDMKTVEIAEKLCKTKGSSTDIKVKLDGSAQTSKILAQVIGVNGKISGTGEFTRSEWDGIRFTNSPEAYINCLELVLPRIKKTNNSR